MYSTAEMVRSALAPGDWVEFPESDPDNPTGTAADLEDVQLDDAIAEADATIDSYLGSHYVSPVGIVAPATTAPHPIDYWSRNIAAYLATLTYRRGQDLAEDDPVVRRYRATMLALVAVRDGKATLPLPVNSGAGGNIGALPPINPYVGDLFGAEDFDLAPVGSSWPNRQGEGGRGQWWAGASW